MALTISVRSTIYPMKRTTLSSMKRFGGLQSLAGGAARCGVP